MLQIGQRLYNLTQDQADALIGAKVEYLDSDGDVYKTTTVSSVDKRRLDWCVSDSNEHVIYLGCDDGFSIRICALPRHAQPTPTPPAGTLDAKIERLRAELAEAEAEKARDGAPKGWRWTNSRRIDNDRGECVWFGPDSQWIYCTDEDGDETAIEFDAVAALVDRVRRDRGETLPQPPAPVSAPRDASSVAIPEGWEVGEDDDGPTMELSRVSGPLRIALFDDDVYLSSETHNQRDVIFVRRDALRAFLALCDK